MVTTEMIFTRQLDGSQVTDRKKADREGMWIGQCTRFCQEVSLSCHRDCEQVAVDWIDGGEPQRPEEMGVTEPADVPKRPHRQRKQPERYGDWYTKS